MRRANLTGAFSPGSATKRLKLDPSWALFAAGIRDIRTLLEQSLQTDPTNQFALRDAGIAYAKAGRRDKAEEMIARFREIAKTQYVPTCRIASIYGELGDRDKAFEELRNAFEVRDWELHRLNADPYSNSFRQDPRFKEILKRLDLP